MVRIRETESIWLLVIAGLLVVLGGTDVAAADGDAVGGYQRQRVGSSPGNGPGPGYGGPWPGHGGPWPGHGGPWPGHGGWQSPPHHGYSGRRWGGHSSEGAWFQRPYPYHLDYYRMRYQGSYAPYFGNLYGPPTYVVPPAVVTPPIHGGGSGGAWYW